MSITIHSGTLQTICLSSKVPEQVSLATMCHQFTRYVELDVLNGILDKAVAALPHALRVGKAVLEMEADDIYHIRDRIQQLCTVKLTDSRLTTHYAIITACALQVGGCLQ